ncbi:Palmitoyltransferase PFA5 [Escovopsis weberi]|uniref:Palmitoyltransferase n=1 Tax=Escovopsis weberi TaxID=150374 RepID=A0A0M8MZC1_ESCWE|nr:Palmitoyltransferase PFA5 [Escovopsis weberi]
MPQSSQSIHARTRWTVRIIPLFILCVFALAVYIIVVRLCIHYLYRQKRQTGVAAVFLALFFLFLVLTLAAYLRTFAAVQLDPGLVPLSQQVEAELEAAGKSRNSWCRRRDRDVEERAWSPPDTNPDSPGLEAFYSKDVFVCEADGRPKWCSECRRWKPDRAHHSSELGRCVRKMDHFCPWVGGMVSETSYNFFAQFTTYCTLFCIICVAVGAYCLRQQHLDGRSVDAWTLTVLILACVFGVFAFGMSLTSLRFILSNTTNIDQVRKTYSMTLAIRIPRTTPPSERYPTIVYPLRTRRLPAPDDLPLSARDQQAERKFAIVRAGPRENPWDLGFRDNWKSVMGDSLVDWLLPLRRSPCCNHESMESDYKYGPLVSQLRKRYGLPDIQASGSRNVDGIEMQSTRKERSQ